MASLSVVVPVYNGARFIADNVARILTYLEARGEGELVVVDDGSSDATADIVRAAFGAGRTSVSRRLISTPVNQGKGHAVRQGLLAARGELRLFVDADLTYPCENFRRIETALLAGADLAIASRVHTDSRYLMAPEFFRHVYTRHHLGRVFNALVQLAAVPGLSDTQAGLKGFRKSAAMSLLPKVTMNRFAFDVELLYLARRARLSIEEVPVTFIYCKEPSSLQLARDGGRMLRDLWTIRRRAGRGDYDHATYRSQPDTDEAAANTSE
ncbi:MAG: glycosyltransferase [Polyangiaceae bacterium]